MKKWEVICLSPSVAATYLKSGWEPFAVTAEKDSSTVAYNSKHLIWLRRVKPKPSI